MGISVSSVFSCSISLVPAAGPAGFNPWLNLELDMMRRTTFGTDGGMGLFSQLLESRPLGAFSVSFISDPRAGAPTDRLVPWAIESRHRWGCYGGGHMRQTLNPQHCIAPASRYNSRLITPNFAKAKAGEPPCRFSPALSGRRIYSPIKPPGLRHARFG